jgi:hypothetical protein
LREKSVSYGLQNTVRSPHNTEQPFKMYTLWCSASQPYLYVYLCSTVVHQTGGSHSHEHTYCLLTIDSM